MYSLGMKQMTLVIVSVASKALLVNFPVSDVDANVSNYS